MSAAQLGPTLTPVSYSHCAAMLAPKHCTAAAAATTDALRRPLSFTAQAQHAAVYT
jgi:hypothetical protein